MAIVIVVYDACVLYPAALRDLLLNLACCGLVQARWTNEIHEEWISNLLEKRPDLTRAQLERTRQCMDLAVPDCLVTGYARVIRSLDLPDPDDRHVLAAAIQAHASTIVTFNIGDFPSRALRPFGIAASHPDQFVQSLIAIDSASVARAAKLQRASLRNPPKTVEEFLNTLEEQGLPKTVSHLRKLTDLL